MRRFGCATRMCRLGCATWMRRLGRLCFAGGKSTLMPKPANQHACLRAHRHTHTRTHTRTHARTHMRARARAHTHTHTHHTQLREMYGAGDKWIQMRGMSPPEVPTHTPRDSVTPPSRDRGPWRGRQPREHAGGTVQDTASGATRHTRGPSLCRLCARAYVRACTLCNCVCVCVCMRACEYGVCSCVRLCLCACACAHVYACVRALA